MWPYVPFCKTAPLLPCRNATFLQALRLFEVAAPVLCSHALQGKEKVMACNNLRFLFHGTVFVGWPSGHLFPTYILLHEEVFV